VLAVFAIEGKNVAVKLALVFVKTLYAVAPHVGTGLAVVAKEPLRNATQTGRGGEIEEEDGIGIP
jgi:hypothetical protein